MGNKTSYHIFQLKTQEGKWEKGLRHVYPHPNECCDDRDLAIATFDSVKTRKAPLFLVEFKKDKKTHEVSYLIVERNFEFKDEAEKEQQLNSALKFMCQKRTNQLF